MHVVFVTWWGEPG